MLNIDGTMFLQIANFLVLLFILNLILFRPIRKILAQREDEMNSRQKRLMTSRIRPKRTRRVLKKVLFRPEKRAMPKGGVKVPRFW